MHWLSWDGRHLRWQVDAQASCPAIELRIDGVRFQCVAPDNAISNDSIFECDFAFSPSGRDELEFSVAMTGVDSTPIGRAWRVRYGAAAVAGIDQWTQAPRNMTPLIDTPALPACGLSELPSVAVVVPIYNSPQCVRRCIAALLRWTPPATRLILIDDASTDPQIGAIFSEYAARENISIQRNPHNRGFTHNVNVGMQLAGDADVVLLNSDTEVGPRWLQSLRLAAYADPAIGTATAVSDNAGAFSVPELEQYCPTPPRWDLPTAQRAVLQQVGLRFPELPTGNGFCMWVKRRVIDRIGLMDEEAFPAGYGEENDFCQRAQQAGFRHIIAGNVLVHHERSASFGDAQRASLGVQGMAVLRKRYPGYESAVAATLHSFERRVLDYRVRRTYAGTDGTYAKFPPRPRVLVAIASANVGIEDLHVENRLAALQPAHEVFVLQSRDDSLYLLRRSDEDIKQVELASVTTDANALNRCVRTWLVNYAIESVCTDVTIGIGATVAELALSLDIPVLPEPR